MESQVTGELMWCAHEPGTEANETRLGATGLYKTGHPSEDLSSRAKGKGRFGVWLKPTAQIST